MNCPNCGAHWNGFIGGDASTISIGRCGKCGHECVCDVIKLVNEKDNQKIHSTEKSE